MSLPVLTSFSSEASEYINVQGESHIDFRTQCVIMTQRTWPPPPAICVISRFSTKLIVFQKDFWMSLGFKKANWIFEKLSNLYLIVLLISFFPPLLWLQQNIKPSWSNYSFELQNQAKRNTTTYKLHLIIH